MTNPTPHDSEAAPTSLDRSKSSVDPLLHLSESQDFFFSNDHDQRQAIYSAMIELEFPKKSIQRYADCSATAFLLMNRNDGKVKTTLATCGSRHCPRCGERYRRLMSEKIQTRMGVVRKNVWRFITLTVKSNDQPLLDQITHLTKSFRRLRQSTIWQQTQLLGYGVIEVTFNDKTNRWHPHLHVISRGNFLHQARLSKQWSIASGGSMICDVRKVKSSRAAAHYISKYLGKNPDFSSFDFPSLRIAEFLGALRNRKLLIAYGVHCIPEDVDASEPLTAAKDGWFYLIDFNRLLIDRRMGLPTAIELFDRLMANRAGRVIVDYCEDT